jgi:hypothetical protein
MVRDCTVLVFLFVLGSNTSFSVLEEPISILLRMHTAIPVKSDANVGGLGRTFQFLFDPDPQAGELLKYRGYSEIVLRATVTVKFAT